MDLDELLIWEKSCKREERGKEKGERKDKWGSAFFLLGVISYYHHLKYWSKQIIFLLYFLSKWIIK